MIYQTPEAYLDAPCRAVALFGMSGLGKTRIASMLRAEADWFHYSVDYRIGTRYMGEHILDNVKREAMRNPFLRGLLRSDSIYIASNITFDNLSPLSTYLGKPGNPELGGLPIEAYRTRQAQHREAEIAALMDTPQFIGKARAIYGYGHFLCDTGGSISEVVDPEDPGDPVLRCLSESVLLVQIRGTPQQADELVRRFERDPKPMYYPPEFLDETWEAYKAETGQSDCEVDPDRFASWGFRRILERRVPRYDAISRNWGVSVEAAEIEAVRTPSEFDALVARAIAAKGV